MTLLIERSHRLGLSDTCPECGYVAPSHFEWLRSITETRKCGDPDKIAVFSSCPMCQEVSWAHYSRQTMGLLRDYPDYLEAVDMEAK